MGASTEAPVKPHNYKLVFLYCHCRKLERVGERDGVVEWSTAGPLDVAKVEVD